MTENPTAFDNDFYKRLFDHLYDGVYLVDRNKKITYWNNGAEKLTGYKSSAVMGKSCEDNILMHVNDKGRHLCKHFCPSEKTIADGKKREKKLYIHHKDGHRIPVLSYFAPVKDARGKVLGAVVVFSDNSAKTAILQRIEELQEMALNDPLTELGNRRYAEITINSRLDELNRYGWNFGILFIDIDGFKRINDTFGHAIGDKAIKMVAKTLSNNVRSFDTVNRWGGEEFVAVLVNVKQDQLHAIAEKLCILVGESGFAIDSKNVHITVSIGATLVNSGDTVESVIKRADELMYQSKSAGGNCVSVMQKM